MLVPPPEQFGDEVLPLQAYSLPVRIERAILSVANDSVAASWLFARAWRSRLMSVRYAPVTTSITTLKIPSDTMSSRREYPR
jgi:hypothetical protein